MSDLVLTVDQERAVKWTTEMSETFMGKPVVGVLRGVAGSGKSSTIKAILASIGSSIIVAPTGKAAQRVQELTGAPAQTIHRWLYTTTEDKRTGDLVFARKELDDIDVSESGVLLLDEASMVPQDLWEDVFNTCSELSLNILVIGDHAQLPPVSKNDEVGFSLVSPDFQSNWSVTLDKIHRQALESPIIAAATEIRCGDVMEGLMLLPRVMVSDLVRTSLGVLDRGGVIICHRNATRHRLNAEIRAARYGTDLQDIRVGEKILVLKNQYGLNRFNGEIMDFRGWENKMNAAMPIWNPKDRKSVTTGFGTTNVGESGVALMATLAMSAVNGGLEGFPVVNIKKAAKKLYPEAPYLHCNYGYVISGHKSQGSQWPEVLVVMEDSIRDNAEGRAWAYTSVTRSEQRCSVCFLSNEALAVLGALQ